MPEKTNLQANNYLYRPIGSYLIEADLVTQEQIFQALEAQKTTKERIGDILVRQGNIKQNTLNYLWEQVIFKERLNLVFQAEDSKKHRLNLPSLNLSPQKILKILSIAIACLILLSFLEKIAINGLNSLATTEFTTRFFGLDEEANFPSLYSTVTLFFCSFLLAIITSIKKSVKSRYVKFWQALSLIFLFLAIDENCSIHEILIPLIRIVFKTRDFFYFPWVIPAFILLIIFLITFREFILNLPAKIRNLFLLAGGIYVTGALGMELISGYLADNSGLETTSYWLAASIEEFLEMFGILIFIYGLLSYIQSYFKEVNISLFFKDPN